MKTYMDKEVLIDFFKAKPKNDEDENEYSNWLSLNKFLKRETDLFLNVDLQTESLDSSSPFAVLISSFGYSSKKVSCTPEIFEFKKNSNFQSSFSNADNLFFINEINFGDNEKWQSQNGYCVASSYDIIKTWKNLNLTYGLPKTLPVRDFEIPFNLKSWEDLKPYRHPVTDIVLSDRFILKNKELFEVNFIPLLTTLISNKKADFNLTLFTSKMEVFERDVNKMKDYLQALLTNLNFNCSVILVYDTIEMFKEHDRHLITNYFHINPGDSFTLFKADGHLKTKGTTVDIKPLVHQDNFNNACAILKNIKRSFDHFNIEKTAGPVNRLLSLFK